MKLKGKGRFRKKERKIKGKRSNEDAEERKGERKR